MLATLRIGHHGMPGRKTEVLQHLQSDSTTLTCIHALTPLVHDELTGTQDPPKILEHLRLDMT